MAIPSLAASFATQTAKGLVLVGFSAEWSVACNTLDDLLSGARLQHPSLLVGRVDIDDDPELAAAEGVSVVPALVLYREGKAVARLVGLSGAEQVNALLAPYL